MNFLFLIGPVSLFVGALVATVSLVRKWNFGQTLAAGIGATVLAGLLMSLSGCEAKAREETEAAIPYTSYEIDGGYFQVAEFRLQDGTRCVVVAGNTGRGIACEWKSVGVER